MTRGKLCLLLIGACGNWADLRGETMTPTNCGQQGLFRCSLPPGWRVTASAAAPDPSVTYRQGGASIQVTRFGGKDSRFRRPQDFQDEYKTNPSPLEAAGTAKVSGRAASLWRRQFDMPTDDEHGSRKKPGWIYEEHVVLPETGRFWVISFERSSRRPPGPKDLKVWRDFLSTFKLEKPARP